MATPTAVAGRYELENRLGAGGMSTVFRARDTVLERPVAVKLLAEHLAEDEAFVARFRREALAAAKLQHPNIVQVFDSGEDPESGRHFIVMEYVEGPSCADLLRQHRMFDADDTVRITRDACQGLDYAHRAGVVHRDVKPGNLLVSNESGTTKLADFGIAKAAEQTRITQVGSVLGTAAYLSPEQASGEEAGPASDIYSLGVCAYQFLAGRLPHEYGSLTELALKQQQDQVAPITDERPDVPAELDRAVRVCLERDPGHRYASALELAEALEAGLHGEVTSATRRLEEDATRALDQTAATRALPSRPGTAVRAAPTPPPPVRREAPVQRRPRQRKRRNPVRAIALLLIAVLALVAIILALALPGGNRQNINRSDVPHQVQDLINYINGHKK
ncbi:MAG: serine/threonine protein kinase [Actinobacteria bacterium]|nr:MAG: serine/threonine protein kinase [Actinomycetota bacterium]